MILDVSKSQSVQLTNSILDIPHPLRGRKYFCLGQALHVHC